MIVLDITVHIICGFMMLGWSFFEIDKSFYKKSKY